MTEDDFTAWFEAFKAQCNSEWEGCICGEPKDHEGLHKCAAKVCTCEWTDAQADEWWESFKQELALRELTRESEEMGLYDHQARTDHEGPQ